MTSVSTRRCSSPTRQPCATRSAGRAAAEPGPRWIAIAAEPIPDVDTAAADMLADLDRELNAEGLSLVLAEPKQPVRQELERHELIGPLKPDHLYPPSTRRSGISAVGGRW